jgi:hypothetical protein
VNGQFAGDTPEATGWSIPNGVHIQKTGSRTSLLLPEAPETVVVERTVPKISAGLYSLDVDVQDDIGTAATVVLQCRSSTGDVLSKHALPEEPEEGEEAVALQQTLRISVLCPDGTESLTIELRGNGTFPVEFRNVHLSAYPLPSVNPF